MGNWPWNALHPLLFTGAAVLAISVGMLVQYVRFLSGREEPPRDKRQVRGHGRVPFIIIPGIIGAAHFAGGWSHFVNVTAWERLNPESIRGATLQERPLEDGPAAEPARHLTAPQARALLETLKGCEHYSRNHEHFSDGYLLTLDVSDRESPLMLSAFTLSHPLAAVRPVSPSSSSTSAERRRT